MKEIRLGSAPLFCFDVRHGKVIPQNCTKETDNSQQHWDVQEVSSDSASEGKAADGDCGITGFMCGEGTRHLKGKFHFCSIFSQEI